MNLKVRTLQMILFVARNADGIAMNKSKLEKDKMLVVKAWEPCKIIDQLYKHQ